MYMNNYAKSNLHQINKKL